MDITPEQQELSNRLFNKYDVLRDIVPSFYPRALAEAEEYHGCYLTFFRYMGMRYFTIYRKDRKPKPEEFLPFLQTLFLDVDGIIGPILEVSKDPYSMEFVQGPNIYTSSSIAEQIGNAVTEYADKHDEVEQVDLESLKNGQ